MREGRDRTTAAGFESLDLSAAGFAETAAGCLDCTRAAGLGIADLGTGRREKRGMAGCEAAGLAAAAGEAEGSMSGIVHWMKGLKTGRGRGRGRASGDHLAAGGEMGHGSAERTRRTGLW